MNQSVRITTSSSKRTGIILAAFAFLLLVTNSYCQARRVSVEGVGVIIRPIDKLYRYKSDHLDTDSWNLGHIFPKRSIPSMLSGMEYATHDFRPASQDSRTDDRIDRFKADAAGDLLIAMPSPAATGDGWVRVNPGSTPDLYLDKIGRSTAASPDPDYPYWLYKRTYTTPGTWVSLPVNSVSTNHPPFVFTNPWELYWENPLELGCNGVIITRMPEGGGTTTLANPKLIVMPNGDYFASIRHATGTSATSVWRSVDKGATWTLVGSDLQVNQDSLFQHKGSIYLIGANLSGSGATRIYKSSDNGVTWTTATFSSSGGGDAPSHVDVVNGRLWKAASTSGGEGFFSAPVDADLMQESSWTLTVGKYSSITLANGQRYSSGNEGTLLTTKEGILINAGKDDVYRPEDGWKDGISLVQPDLTDITKTTYDPDYAGPRLPGSGSKYTVRYDPVSDRYWALTSGGDPRTNLNLYSASSEGGRIGDFRLEKTVLRGVSTGYHGFNYPFMQIDGDDIIFTSRTAWETNRGQATRWHDGNIFTFHRIKNFRGEWKTDPPLNPGFELNMYSWSTSGANPDAAYTHTLNPHTGLQNLAHGKSSAYQVYTYQTIKDLKDGIYTFKAWVKSTGGQNACYINAIGSGNVEYRQDLPVSETYVQIEIPSIIVTNGMCTIGLWSDSLGGYWATVDDVEFYQVDDCGYSYEELLKLSSEWLRGSETVAYGTLHQYHFDSGAMDAVETNGIGLTLSDEVTAEGALDVYDGVSGDGPVAYATSNPFLMSEFTGDDGAFTFEAFIYPFVEYDTWPNTMQIMTMDNNGQDYARGWHFGISVDNKLQFLKITDSFEKFAVEIPTTGEHAYSTGSWYHVAVTYNGLEEAADNLKLYWTNADSDIVEANLLGAFTLNQDLNPAVESNFAVGNELRSFGGFSENFEGLIDEVRISSVAREASDMLKRPEADPMISDLSNNGVVDLVDFAILSAEWMKCSLIDNNNNSGIVSLEAENGVIGSHWIIGTDSDASGGLYIEVDPDYNNTSDTPECTSAECLATYDFDIATSGNYRFWFRILSDNAGDDSFFWRIDSGTWIRENNRYGMGWWLSTDNAQIDSISAGHHVLQIASREDGTRLDKFVIQLDSLASPGGDGPPETE